MANYDYTAFEQYGTETSRKPSYSGTIRQRHFYTEPQVALLEAEFATEAFPNKDRRRRIALQLGVSEKSIMWWYQNRRRRVRQQCKALGDKPAQIRSRRQRRSIPYTSYEPESQQEYSTDSVQTNPTVVNGSIWPDVSYPMIQTDETNHYQEQSNIYTTTESPVFQQELSCAAAKLQWPQLTLDLNSSYPTCSYESTSSEPNFPLEYQQNIYQPSYSNWTNWEYTPPFLPVSSSTPTEYSDCSNLVHQYFNHMDNTELAEDFFFNTSLPSCFQTI